MNISQIFAIANETLTPGKLEETFHEAWIGRDGAWMGLTSLAIRERNSIYASTALTAIGIFGSLITESNSTLNLASKVVTAVGVLASSIKGYQLFKTIRFATWAVQNGLEPKDYCREDNVLIEVLFGRTFDRGANVIGLGEYMNYVNNKHNQSAHPLQAPDINQVPKEENPKSEQEKPKSE